MLDYIGSGIIIIFIVLVLVLIKRRETREKLAAEARAPVVAPEGKPTPASQNQLAADRQHRDDPHG